MKKFEDQAIKNGLQEDKLEEEVYKLSETLKNKETRAEFGERTVEKLENSIDGIQEMLFSEKADFIELSRKLDETLQNMMAI